MSKSGQTNRDQIFTKYPHDLRERHEVPLHSHRNGQLNYVTRGTMRLVTPNGSWVVPQERIVWVPPGLLHSARSQHLSGSWKIMVPPAYSRHLSKHVSVLRTSELLVAALAALPEKRDSISPAKLKLLIELIRIELLAAKSENFGVTLPKSPRFSKMVSALLRTPEDPREIDQWAKQLGMSRRTFTRNFLAETGFSFGEWRKTLLLEKALDLLGAGLSVSEVSERLGYSGPSAFVAVFRKRFGVSPGRFFRTSRSASPGPQ